MRFPKRFLPVLFSMLAIVTPAFGALLCLDYELRVFVEESVARDPGFARALQVYLKTKYNRLSNQAVAAWTLSAAANVNQVENFGDNVFQPEQIRGMGYELYVQKLFFETGTRLTLGHRQQALDYHYSPQTQAIGANFLELSEDVQEPRIELSLIQPLLRNAFGLADRYPILAAELQQAAGRLDAEEAWENRLAELYGVYLGWAEAYQSALALRQQAVELEKVARLVNQKVQARVAERTDWLRVRENQMAVNNQLTLAEARLQAEAARVLYLRNGRPAAPEELTSLAPVMAATLQECEDELSRPAPAPGALRMIGRLDLLRQQLAAQEQLARQGKLPQLDLVGSAAAKGQSRSAGEWYPALSRNDYSLRLQASYPLGDPRGRAELGQAQAGLEEVQAARAISERDLHLALEEARQNLSALQQVAANNRETVTLADEKLALNLRNYRIGRLDTFLLLDSVNAVINARLQEVRSAIQFKRALVGYLGLTDRLLLRHHDLAERLRQAGEGH